VEHRGNGDQHASEEPGHIAPKHPHNQGAFHAQVERLVSLRPEHAREHASREDRRTHQGQLDALRQRPFFAHQHALKPAAARKNARQRRGDCELY